MGRHRWRWVLQHVVRRAAAEDDLDAEIRSHLALETQRHIDTGLSPDEARRLASREFGNVLMVKEVTRDMWGWGFVESWTQDVRYAGRMLRKRLGFTAVAVASIGLGIGANTAFFSVINAALIRPLGYSNADQLVAVHEAFPQAGIDRFPFSALDFDDFQNYQQSFESAAAYRSVSLELSVGGNPERIEGTKVSAGLFRTLGVDPILGRAFSTAEDRPGINVAILSWGLWQERYASDPAIVGQSIQLDRQPYTVVGIMPATFVFPRHGPQVNSQPADVWVPIAFTARERRERASMHTNSVVARLKDGVSFEAAEAELDVLAGQIAENYPPAVRDAGFSPRLTAAPLREEISGRFKAPLLMLMAAVGLVLLVACANVANLILSRVAGRTPEFAMRTALGAGRNRLVQLLLCEASLLAVAGGVTGLTAAYWGVKAVPSVIARTIPGLQDVAIDFRVLAFTSAMCFATTVIFGLLPLATLDPGSPNGSLRGDMARATGTPRNLLVQRSFVVSTVGLAFVLLIGAGLFIRSFSTLLSTDLGFRPSHVVTASMTLPRLVYTTATSVRTFHESLYRSLLTLPGVRSVALATDLPLTTYERRAFTPEGFNLPEGARPTTHLTWVHGPYFETLGMTLRQGRFFVTDEHAQSRAVVVVNEHLAERSWPGENPIGKRLKWGGNASQSPWLTVVGVVASVTDGPIGAEPEIHAYEPFRQLPDFVLNGAANQFFRDVKAAVLVQGDPRALPARIRQEISTLDRDLAIQRIELMDQQVSDVLAPQRFSTLLVAGFGAVALFLASVGLYGLLAFRTTQRTREIAVRRALGADRRAVVRMVVAEGAQLVAFGLTAGLIISLGLSRFLASLLYQTSQYDLMTFLVVPAVLSAAALIACAVPARRAARVDPLIALRAE